MSRKLGLVAGSGALPFEVAEAARESGLAVAIVAIQDQADPAIERLASQEFSTLWAGELGRLIDLLKAWQVDEVILAGAVAKREALRDLSALHLDARALAVLARLKERGDDALLRAVAGELEAEDLPVVDSTSYLQNRLTRAGLLAGPPLEPRAEADLAFGLRVAKSLGRHDVGQSVVVKEGTVLAVEAVEGTDAAIRRGTGFSGNGAVVVKASKPRQDLRFDVPAIGTQTIELAHECGVIAIGLEVNATLVLDRTRALREAERHGISVVGLRPEEE